MRITKKMKKSMAHNQKRIVNLLEETGVDGIDDLVTSLEDSDFFSAPASTRLDYHGAHPGGLAAHSVNVYDLFSEKVERFGLDLMSREVAISSLCHDMCKIGLYVPNILKSGELSKPKPYVVQDELPYGHGERSVAYVSRHIDLTRNERLLMRWHMGGFDPAWEFYERKVPQVCPAIHAFQTADQEASKYLDVKL